MSNEVGTSVLSPKEIRSRMEVEYIRGATVEELAERYGYSLVTVKQYRSRGKWNVRKKEFQNNAKAITRDVTSQVYAGFKAEINIKYHSAWARLMDIVEMALDHPEKYLFHPDGNIRLGALDMISNILTKAQAGQEKANGNIPPEVAVKLSIELEKLNILKEQQVAGQNADILQDNFVDALNQAATNVWQDFQVGSVKNSMNKQIKFAEKLPTDEIPDEP